MKNIIGNLHLNAKLIKRKDGEEVTKIKFEITKIFPAI